MCLLMLIVVVYVSEVLLTEQFKQLHELCDKSNQSWHDCVVNVSGGELIPETSD